MQMHQNRKADWAVTAQCYSNRGPSAGEIRDGFQKKFGSV